MLQNGPRKSKKVEELSQVRLPSNSAESLKFHPYLILCHPTNFAVLQNIQVHTYGSFSSVLSYEKPCKETFKKPLK